LYSAVPFDSGITYPGAGALRYRGRGTADMPCEVVKDDVSIFVQKKLSGGGFEKGLSETGDCNLEDQADVADGD
jgi:hypothetical protein